ncbi:MAG TPA: diacylglycerol kinase family protein [Gemmatimonas sp.]|nr:diacylglycerol kinase family protein [Gemmatimonas sp.]
MTSAPTTRASQGADVRILVNCNAKAMQDPAGRDALVEQVRGVMPDAQVWFTADDVSIDDLIARATRDGATMLVAGGGDGTVNAVASAVIGTQRTLGVLPLGTLNHFAKDLAIPFDIEAAVLLLRDGMVCDVDVGEVNDRVFINNSGLGLYPDIVRQRERRQEAGSSKWPAAFVSALHALRRYRTLGIRVMVGGKALYRRTPAVFIGNNEYTTDSGLEPKRPSLSDGCLSLYMPHPHGRARLLWFSLRALLGNSGRLEGFDVVLTDSLSIESRHRRLHVALDGEVAVMETPLNYRTRARALRVLVPTIVR